jgi:two-component sensor histidine kinase
MANHGTRVFPGLSALAIEPVSTQAFGLALVCTLAALGLRLAIGYVDPDVPPFPTFLVSILLTTLLAGMAAGLVAAALGLISAWWAFATLMPADFSPAAIVLYAVVSLLIIWISEHYRTVLRRLHDKEAAFDRHLALIVSKNEVLAQIVSDAPLSNTLELLARSIEEYSGGQMLASVLLVDNDGRRLRHGAAPSLPDTYNRAIDGLEIGPSAGSCGTAAFRKKPVYVTDVQNDPLWAEYRELALSHGLKACWSTPLLSGSNAVLGTFALYHREPRAPSQHEKEIVELFARITTIAIEHDHALNQRRLLVDELTHRVRNTLTVVRSIAARTLRSRIDESAYQAFEDRLLALSRVQSLLTQTNWSDVDVRELVTSIAVTPFAADAARFCLDGPSAKFPARLVLPFALTLHELSTNAAKYGALTTDQGRVLINWGYTGNGDLERKFFFRWSEAGGPSVQSPSREGFGSRLIRQAFSAECGGSATIDYRPDGIVCEISFPLGEIPPAGSPGLVPEIA